MKKIAVLFPGYGSQYVGMAKEFYDESRIVQEYFEEAGNCLPINFVRLCFASSDAEISRMENAYPATFLVSCAIHAMLQQEGIVADIFCGYNQGEYAALYAAGAFTFPDGLYLLNKYATIYQEVLTTLDAGAIHVQGVPTIVLEKICKKASVNGLHASIGICTGPADHVITGNEAAVADVRGQIAKDFDVSIADISLEIGLHSSLMQEVADRWAPYLEKVDFKDVALPIISSTQASLLRTGEEIKKHILAHMVSPVKWPLVMDALDQYDILVEVCPGKQLSSLAKEKYPDKIVLSINKRSDVSDLKKIVDNSSQTAEL